MYREEGSVTVLFIKVITMISRFKIVQLHMLLSSFVLPAVLLFIVSGALYTLGVKGSVAKQTFTVALEKPFAPNLELLTGVVEKTLVDKALVLPDGDPSLKKSKGGYKFRWDDLRYSVTVVAKKGSRSVDLTYRERSVLTQVMRIHRAEAGTRFKFVSIMAVAGLLLVFASGLYMAYTVPKFRKPSLIATGLGILILLAVVVA
ncbi:MAG: hypothetical protein PF439_04215 [Helicobacteraceae bacterium]|jgi:hypothetical protein|nr:hypothetical protein [Helicobacteraceae bacterium]